MRDVLFMAYPLIDLTVQIEDTLPVEAGQTKPVSSMAPEPGGGANIVFMATRLGLDIVQVGTVGQDPYGNYLIEKYGQEGTETRYLEQVPDFETQVAICVNDASGKHAFISMLDGRLARTPCPEELVEQSGALCISGYMLAAGDGDEVIRNLLQKVENSGKTVFFDPGPLYDRFPAGSLEYILSCTDVLVLNDEEAMGIARAGTVEEAAALLGRDTGGTVVVKNGGAGCYLYQERVGTWCEGFDVPLVDTTGAGDSFLGAFMRGYVDGWDIFTVCRVANAAGAAKVQKPGCGTQVPTLDEVLHILNTNGYNVSREQMLDRENKLCLQE